MTIVDELPGLFFDSTTPPQGEPVRVSVRGSMLAAMRADGHPFLLALDACDIRWGGAQGNTIVFSDGALMPSMVFVEDTRLLEWIEETSPPEVADRARQMRRGGERSRLGWRLALGAFGLAVTALVLGALAGFPWLVDFAVGFIPPSWERAAGASMTAQMIAGQRELDDEAVLAGVRRMTGPLLDAAGKVPYPFEFHVLEDSSVNAFAVPGGQVVLLTGLLESARSADEVAGVLAHELQHVLRRHSLRRLTRQLGIVLVVGLLLGDAGGLAQGTSSLLDSKFSRQEEAEADVEGARLLLAAGIPVEGMAAFFDRMAAGGGRLEKVLEFASSHPASQGRAEAIRRLAVEEGGGKKLVSIALDWKAFQARVKGAGSVPAAKAGTGTEFRKD